MYDSNANLTALLPVIPHVGSNLIIHIIIECTFRNHYSGKTDSSGNIPIKSNVIRNICIVVIDLLTRLLLDSVARYVIITEIRYPLKQS